MPRGPEEYDDAEASQGVEEELEERPAKKSRMLEFPQGTIKKIRVHDFMTYAGCVTIAPGPKLNLVLGPNGTGKSSLVCAICVGLGGSTKLLGRADNLADFIRRGKTSCWTEITLSAGAGRSRDYVLRRDIRVETQPDGSKSYKSHWKMNGKECPHREVKDLVAKFNIQFENLCQFLPQDKVAEFAMMNSRQLLEATEKAIGDAKLYDQHQLLIQSNEQLKQDKQARDNNERTLQKLQTEHQRQQRDFEKFEAREKLKQAIELLNAKILWLEHNLQVEKYEEAKQKLAAARAKLEKAKGEMQADTEPMRVLEAQADKVKARRDKIAKALVNIKRSIADNGRQVDQVKVELDDTLTRRSKLKALSEARTAKLAELQDSVRQLRIDIAAAPADAPPHMLEARAALAARADACWRASNDLDEAQQGRRNGQAALDRQLNDVAARLGRLRDVRMQRLRLLEQRRGGAGVTHMYEWVQASAAAGLFRGPVIGPLGLEVQPRPEYAIYVENNMFPRLLNFVVSCPEDQQVLTDHMNTQRYSFTVSTSRGTGPMTYPLGRASQYAAVGVAHTLDEVFEAPDLIKHYLKDYTGITRVFVLKDNADPNKVVEAMGGRGGNVTMYRKGERCTHSQSKYNKDGKSLAWGKCRGASILSRTATGVEAEEQAAGEERRELLEEREKLSAALREGQAQEAALRQEGQQLQGEMQELDREIERIRRQRQDLGKMLKVKEGQVLTEQSREDPLAREGELLQVIKGLADKLQRLGIAGHNAVRDAWEATKEQAALDLTFKEMDMQASALAEAGERRLAAVRSAEEVVQQAAAGVERAGREVKEAKALRMERAPSTPELIAVLKEQPLAVDEVREQIREREKEMDDLVCSNPNVLKEYTARQAAISALEHEVEHADAALEELQSSMQSVRDEWLPELSRIVQSINASFSVNFAQIGCAGEVVLEEGALQAEDYEKCALEIRVKFRESEGLTVLTNTRQSGGERSVSTLLFLIALQGVTITPFRVIDEINQGMDPINERKVFTQLVNSACRPDTPQCFLLTPKLLPGLYFTPDITVLNIMNGNHIHTQLPPLLENKHVAMFGRRCAGGAAHRPAAAMAAS